MKNYEIIHFWLEVREERERVLSKGYGMGSESSLEIVHVNEDKIASKI
jgi:hypothetical protein